MRIGLIIAFIAALANPSPEVELLTPCGYSAPQLEAALLCDLKQLADEFIEAEQETGVNAIFLASVAALESGWGKSHKAKEHNNLFGWGNYSFASQEVCIDVVAKALAINYLTPGGKHYNGGTVEGVSIKYNNTDHWRQQVRQIMADINRRLCECDQTTRQEMLLWIGVKKGMLPPQLTIRNTSRAGWQSA